MIRSMSNARSRKSEWIIEARHLLPFLGEDSMLCPIHTYTRLNEPVQDRLTTDLITQNFLRTITTLTALLHPLSG